MIAGRLPLDRFLVIDLTLARAGPTCVRQLADWGANVIRIEPPGDETVDVTGSRRESSDGQNLHRNKRAIGLNLKSEEGKAIFMKFAAKADVIVENWRSDVKHRLGVDYEAVSKINPRIVYGSLSGFGQDGPYATRAGVDQIAQGMSGLMSITGEPGKGPMRVGIPIADTSSGLFLFQAIMVALLDREHTGKGQWVQTSLIESLLFMLDFQGTRWTNDHEVPQQAGNDHPTSAATGAYSTTDGYINLSGTGSSMWTRLCQALGDDAFTNDPAFASNAERTKNRVMLKERITAITRQHPTAHWIKKLEELGVPGGPIYTIDQAFEDPQAKHLGMVKDVKHKRLGNLKVTGQPFRLSATPQPAELKPAPDPSEHTVEILREWGYSDADITGLKSRGVIS